MFANIFFSKKKMPAYKSAYSTGRDSQNTVPFVKAYILNDDAKPPKTLIGLRIYYVPADDAKAGKIHGDKYEREAFVGLPPEEAFKFTKHINRLLSEVSKKENYLK